MLRSTPERTWVVSSMILSRCDGTPVRRWAARRMDSSSPPTFTMAMPSTLSLMPWADTASRTLTSIFCDDRSSTDSCCTNGTTKTPPPVTTFWPDRSPLVLPLRPVTMNAWLGLATL